MIVDLARFGNVQVGGSGARAPSESGTAPDYLRGFMSTRYGIKDRYAR